ncbi:MAG: hypothetical protein K6F07_00530 [Bacilli bacterium]|nr:hypothetical protein [Bacilli bacterium]
MGKIKRVLRCYNCGAVLQSEDKEEPGYVSRKLLEASREDLVIYCQKCFDKMKVINTGNLEQNIDQETFKILDDAKATDAIIVWVIDLFSFNGTIPPEIVKKIKKLEVTVIATHRDLFAKSLDNNMFVNYINERFNEAGLTLASVHILGNEDEMSIEELLTKDGTLRKGHDVYILGSLASGKTSLINKLLKTYKNKTKWQIKTEYYPGTGLKVMSIPLSNSTFIYELPGLSLATSVAGRVEKDVVKLITPKKKVTSFPRTLLKGDALMVGSLGCFALINGKATIVKFFSAEGVETKKIKLKNVEEHLRENAKRASVRPVSEHYSDFKDFDLFEYDMEDDGLQHDISISGLGWISFVAKGQTIRVMIPHGVAVKESLSKIRKD